MCGRVVQKGMRRGEVNARFSATAADNVAAHYNLAPTNQLLTIREEGSTYAWASCRWGLIPSWAKDTGISSKTFNARADTVTEKPSFRSAFKNRRCLIPVDGFYEWYTEGKKKTPFFISNANPNEMLVFAGLWETWRGPEGEIQSCTIITTEPNAFISELHNRMPVILGPDAWNAWLAGSTSPADLQVMLRPCPEEWLQAWQVGALRGDGPELIEPVA